MAFESAATSLVPDDGNGVRDVFLVDRTSGAMELISRGTGGAVGDAASYSPTISGDGTIVAFVSEATNLSGAGSGPGVYLFDRTTSQVSRIPLASGERADARDVLRHVISLSGDGRFAAFTAYQEPETALTFVVLFDRTLGTLTRFSASRDIGTYGSIPHLNAAGSLLAVAYYHYQLGVRFVRIIDLVNGTFSDLAPAPGKDCGNPSLSDSGRWVAYECRGVPDAVPVNTRLTRVYLHDRMTNTSVEVSAPPAGVARRHSLASAINADGRYVVFTSFTRLLPSVTGEVGQVYRYDRDTGTLELMSRNLAGVPFFFGAYGAATDATGALVALSTSQAVDVSDTNARDDVYLVDPTCQYAVSAPNPVFPSGGGPLSIAVTSGSGCLWTSGPGVQGFFGVNLPAGGTGSGTQTLTAGVNLTGAVRTGTVSVAGKIVSVSQNPAAPPTIVAQPVDTSVATGATAIFSVTATADPAPTYQWQLSSNGIDFYNMGSTPPYSGATTQQLTIQNVPPNPFWNRFRVVVSNVAGSLASAPARLWVVADCTYSDVIGELVLPAGGGKAPSTSSPGRRVLGRPARRTHGSR